MGFKSRPRSKTSRNQAIAPKWEVEIMKRHLLIGIAGVTAVMSAFLAGPSSPGIAYAQAQDAATTTEHGTAPEPLSADELEVLVARIALYPDELVAVISAASLYPLQIVEARASSTRSPRTRT